MITGDIETSEKIEYEDLLKNYYEKMEIIEEQDKEIERLNSIIKEVREEIRILRTNCDISNVHAMKLFQTLDKVDKEKSDE